MGLLLCQGAGFPVSPSPRKFFPDDRKTANFSGPLREVDCAAHMGDRGDILKLPSLHFLVLANRFASVNKNPSALVGPPPSDLI